MALREQAFGLLPVTEVDAGLLTAFRCGKPHLDQYLVGCADMHRDRLGHTSVVFHEDVFGAAIGYFTLANDAIPLSTSEQGNLGLHDQIDLKAYPAVKICRFAVSEALQGQGVGPQILELVLGEVLGSASLSAARLVTVDADNEPSVLRFYVRHGFEISLWADKIAKNNAPGNKAPSAAL